jgi:5-methylthioribose kinase
MCTIIMEYIGGEYSVFRNALLARKTFPFFAEQVSTYLINSLFATSDISRDHIEKKDAVKKFMNPEMCDIMEKLIYTEPFGDIYNRNRVMPQNIEFVKKEFYGDDALRLEAAKLKFEYMNSAQALIHGDFHTSSFFVNNETIKVFDTEFAFFGPIGYDLGDIIAHLFFAWANADAGEHSGIEDKAATGVFKKYILDTIAGVYDLFIQKYKAGFPAHVSDPMARTPGFAEWYLDQILLTATGSAGAELARRTIGMSYVEDLVGIKDENIRARAERLMLCLSKYLLLNRAAIKIGGDYAAALDFHSLNIASM